MTQPRELPAHTKFSNKTRNASTVNAQWEYIFRELNEMKDASIRKILKGTGRGGKVSFQKKISWLE